MHTVYTIPMLRLSVHSVHQCATPFSLMRHPPLAPGTNPAWPGSARTHAPFTSRAAASVSGTPAGTWPHPHVMPGAADVWARWAVSCQ